MTAGMSSANAEREEGAGRALSALPSVQARVLAFGAIVIAGVCGGLIGFSAVKVGCQGSGPQVAGVARSSSHSCSTPAGIGGLVGALIAAVGVAVISVLVLRAMGEWRSIKEKREIEMQMSAEAERSAVAALAERTAMAPEAIESPALADFPPGTDPASPSEAESEAARPVPDP
jgi:hypothetical protein